MVTVDVIRMIVLIVAMGTLRTLAPTGHVPAGAPTRSKA